MATPCGIRLETSDMALVSRVAVIAEDEARRIEAKFSRYRADSVVSRINRDGHFGLVMDAETTSLLDYAAACHGLSGGLFDVTSGVLRRAWQFDGSDRIPDRAQVRSLMPLVGWTKVVWRPPELILPRGMEIDFGGVAKEYAVDSVLAKLRALTDTALLVNFGGDLAVTGARRGGEPWHVAIESVEQTGSMAGMIELSCGALATSGDARRFLLKDGVRYSHILDPRTGWPVENPPRSVTVAAASCVEAGLTATLAMLNGREAEAFLRREKINAWCIR